MTAFGVTRHRAGKPTHVGRYLVTSFIKRQPADFPFAVYGPGNMTQHQVNESLPKQMFYDFIAIYQQLFIRFLAE